MNGRCNAMAMQVRASRLLPYPAISYLPTGEVRRGKVDVGELEDVEEGDEVVVHQRPQRRLGARHVHLRLTCVVVVVVVNALWLALKERRKARGGRHGLIDCTDESLTSASMAMRLAYLTPSMWGMTCRRARSQSRPLSTSGSRRKTGTSWSPTWGRAGQGMGRHTNIQVGKNRGGAGGGGDTHTRTHTYTGRQAGRESRIISRTVGGSRITAVSLRLRRLASSSVRRHSPWDSRSCRIRPKITPRCACGVVSQSVSRLMWVGDFEESINRVRLLSMPLRKEQARRQAGTQAGRQAGTHARTHARTHLLLRPEEELALNLHGVERQGKLPQDGLVGCLFY